MQIGLVTVFLPKAALDRSDFFCGPFESFPSEAEEKGVLQPAAIFFINDEETEAFLGKVIDLKRMSDIITRQGVIMVRENHPAVDAPIGQMSSDLNACQDAGMSRVNAR